MITIELEDHEALVLFEFLAREIDDRNGEQLAKTFVHPAEFWALNSLNCLLERVLAEPFSPQYGELVAAARKQVITQCDPEGTFGPIGGEPRQS